MNALAAVGDADPGAASAAAQSSGAVAREIDEILDDPSISGIIIATPDATHALLATRALCNGKHVLVEKPMATSVGDATEIAECARQSQRVLMVGHILLYHPAFLRLLEETRKKRLGKVRHISSKRLHLARGARRHALWDLAPHDLSMILEITGSMPQCVHALAQSPMPDAPPQSMTVHLLFKDGVTADIALSAIHPAKLHQITVAGSEAFGIFDDTKSWEEKVSIVAPGLGGITDGTTPQTVENIALAADEPLKREIGAFLDAMRSGAVPASHAEEGLRVVEILAAAEESIRSGEPVFLDRRAPAP